MGNGSIGGTSGGVVVPISGRVGRSFSCSDVISSTFSLQGIRPFSKTFSKTLAIGERREEGRGVASSGRGESKGGGSQELKMKGRGQAIV